MCTWRERGRENEYAAHLSLYQNLEQNLINIKNQVDISYYCYYTDGRKLLSSYLGKYVF